MNFSQTLPIKNINVLPTDWHTRQSDSSIESDLCVQFTFLTFNKTEEIISIFPPKSQSFEEKINEIYKIIQNLPIKIKAGFNPLLDDFYEFNNFYLDYNIELTPETDNLKNGSIHVKIHGVNQYDYVFILNESYSNVPVFTNLKNGNYDLTLVHVQTNQTIKKRIALRKAELNDLSPHLNVLDGFYNAFLLTNGGAKHKDDFFLMLKRVNKALIELNLHHKRICDFTKSDLKSLFEYLNFKPHYHNKLRTNFLIIYKVLMNFEIVDVNLVSFVSKKQILQKLQSIIPNHVLDQILEYFYMHNYPYYRYIKIFYHSGARTTELFDLKAKDVSLTQREFKIIINKGNRSKEAIKAILPDVYNLWVEIMNETKSLDDYLFSISYLPGSKKQKAKINSHIWRKYVIKKLNHNFTFYSLKHKFLDYIDQYQDSISKNSNLATVHASHSNKSITETHYLVGKNKRQIEALKSFSLVEYMNEN
jgi:integrase